MPSVTAQPDLTSPLASSPEAHSSPQSLPDLVHNLKHGSSVLALAVSPQHDSIYAGTQDGEIVAWSLATFHQVHQVQAHKRSVLSLFLSPDASLLFSSAGDPVINVWCPRTLRRLYEVYGIHDVGDVFCTAYSPQHDTLYLGAQNTTIQWVGLGDPSVKVPPGSQSHPDRRNHRFFDSKAVGGTSTPRRSEGRWSLIPRAQAVLEIDGGSVRHFAHNGYVYCMLMAKGPTVEVNAGDDVLISGGGDGTIKLWSLSRPQRPQAQDDDSDESQDGHGHIEELMTLGNDDADSVLSLALDGSFLYAGKLDGIVELWDLDTTQRLRVIKAHGADVMSLHMGWGYLWTASANGCASRYSIAHYGANCHASPGDVTQKYRCLSKWRAHEGKILASAVTTYGDHKYFITGANDDEISIWSTKDKACCTKPAAEGTEDLLFSTLSDFVSYKTVSSRPEYAEDCRKGATFLGALFKRLGGHVEMLSTEKAHNPVVYARFSGKKEAAEGRKRILFYGHYDVVAADNKNGKWMTDPFILKGTNGFLYGRGVSDNKGPVVAALFAVTDLMQAQKLENDVVFLIEGEEEVGSRGFEEAVERHRGLIGHVDYILLANSYWLDDEVPCLTYGLRGVLHATVSVDAPRPDLHSGVDGSYMVDEPLSDLTSILSKLKGAGNRIQIPGFYDGIPPMRPEEETRYDAIASILMQHGADNINEDKLKQSLMARWREPNLTIHRYKVSGPEGSLISSHASSHISLRLVPGQEVEGVTGALSWFLQREFALLNSQNRLNINIDNKAEPWLGDPTNAIFRTLGQAIVEAWPDCFNRSGSPGSPVADDKAAGSLDTKPPKPRQPLYIREGGSIPAIRFLEKAFGAPAAHLPCGRASDAAHLDNERMSMVNLLKAREIFGKVFARL
ncbi:peptidase [Hirsutella rhossiliensis]|uniref:Peptidase family m20/M25/M40 domain-containing protein n=1 Tax=Hirsutella rhossiliensis TaxID=111463 RepID=A0A9P8SCE6_9HYPO|nr:peptidase family m20/M25/M40 domain-containing protein [Hirsutella rhossiliensis]KAH0957558.1 peptidase family m20/M25/M40 domain-containing protein [Hirsutella rhossiliensis]